MLHNSCLSLPRMRSKAVILESQKMAFWEGHFTVGKERRKADLIKHKRVYVGLRGITSLLHVATVAILLPSKNVQEVVRSFK